MQVDRWASSACIGAAHTWTCLFGINRMSGYGSTCAQRVIIINCHSTAQGLAAVSFTKDLDEHGSDIKSG